MTGTAQITGLRDLDKQLKKLNGALEGKIVRAGLNAANRIVRDAARKNAPVDDGDLKKSIRVSSKVDKKKGRIISKVVAGNKDVYYAHFIEYGTASYYTGTGDSARKAYEIKPAKKGGFLSFGSVHRAAVDHPGVKPQPFMRPAFDQNIEKALSAFSKKVKQRLEKEAAKGFKK